MGRRKNPATRYKVYLQQDGKYRYASVQIPRPIGDTHKGYKIVHLGTVDQSMVFTPNPFFRLMDVEERVKYIFPAHWDISKATAMNDTDYLNKQTLEQAKKILEQAEGSALSKTVEVQIAQDDKNLLNTAAESSGNTVAESSGNTVAESSGNTVAESSGNTVAESSGCRDAISLTNVPANDYIDQYNNKLYGSFWLLEQIAKNEGLYDDVLNVFHGNIAKTNEILSLAFFPYLSERNFSRFSKWQNTHETLLEYSLSSPAITKLTQNITDNDRMSLIGLRIKRLPSGSQVDLDSTTRSAWGKCLADIHWGKNKDNRKLQNTVEVVVYSLTTHQPIYYRSFPGNMNDMATVRTVLKDLSPFGIKDIIFTTDRGYCSDENIAAFVAADLPFLMCAKVGAAPIAPLLLDLTYDSDGIPNEMEYNEKTCEYYIQKDVPAYQSRLCDGTEVAIEGLKANLFMNPQVRVIELGDLKRKIDDERSTLDEDIRNHYVPENVKNYNALFKYHKVVYAYENGKPVGIAYETLQKQIAVEKSQCGFYASLMFKQNKTAKEALIAYKIRDEHEKNFNQMKDQMLFKVQRNSSEDGKNGRSFILFVGLIAISVLQNVWRTSDAMQQAYESTYDMLDEMEPIRMSRYGDGSTHITTFTGKQVTIAMEAKVEVPLECMSPSVRREYEQKLHPKKRKHSFKQIEEQLQP